MGAIMRSTWTVAGFMGVFAFATVVSWAADWGQWRGPQRTGVSRESGLADQWPQTGPRLVWRVEHIENGYGSPAIVDNRIYLISNEGVDNEFVQALDAATGQPIWKQRIGKVGKPDQQPPYPAARSTPTVDGNVLYAFGSDGDIACLDTASGDIRWHKNVREEFGGVSGTWAYAESPLVDGDRVICSPGGPEAAMVALNKQTGDVIWKAVVPPREDGSRDEAGYASAIIVNAGGIKQYVQFMSKGVVGVAADDGRFLWRYDGTGAGPANMATPIAQDGFVYTPGRPGGALIELTRADGGIEVKEVYLKRGLPNAIGGAVLIGDHLYGTTREGLVCADFKTGEIKWQDASVGVGSICSADGLLFVHSEDGQVALVEATPDAYREKGRIALSGNPQHTNEREKSWAYPVVANGRLYVRDKNVLWCYGISETTLP
jgi:outer membrane protein assembly factor BamB